MRPAPAWIAVDWGTTSLRGWAIGADGAILSEARSDKGMASLARDEFEPALRDLVSGWRPAPIFACGMVGARQGWIEAGYAAVPCSPNALTTVKAPVSDTEITIVGGVKQERPADVMRGEEMQIFGFLAGTPDFDGILCLPGTHTKWVQVSAGEIVSFRTVMTGELFGLLAKASVLRHALAEGWDEAAFDEAVSDTLSRPEMLAARLFEIRAESLLCGLDGSSARARLSGVLIGAELAAMRPYWLGQNLAVVGESGLNRVYSKALAAQGAAPLVAAGEDMTRRGLAGLRARLEDRS